MSSKNSYGGIIISNKNYVKGRAFEYQIKKLFEKKGFMVFRTAGSHSPADLIAFTKLEDWFRNKELGYVPILIQCKNTQKKTYTKEITVLKSVAKEYGLRALLATKRNGKVLLVPIVEANK